MDFVGNLWQRRRLREGVVIHCQKSCTTIPLREQKTMKNKMLGSDAPRKETDQSAKAPYSSPVLRVFGTVGKLTKGGNGSGMDFTKQVNANPNKHSDRNTKEKIVRVGDHPFGIGLYLFDYKTAFRASCGQGRQFGVMADEVESVMPGAVSLHPDGYKQVNYAMLGISLNTH